MTRHGHGSDGAPPQGHDFADFVRRALHAAADQVEPRPDGLERIRARVGSGPAYASKHSTGTKAAWPWSPGFLAGLMGRWNAWRGGQEAPARGQRRRSPRDWREGLLRPALAIACAVFAIGIALAVPPLHEALVQLGSAVGITSSSPGPPPSVAGSGIRAGSLTDGGSQGGASTGHPSPTPPACPPSSSPAAAPKASPSATPSATPAGTANPSNTSTNGGPSGSPSGSTASSATPGISASATASASATGSASPGRSPTSTASAAANTSATSKTRKATGHATATGCPSPTPTPTTSAPPKASPSAPASASASASASPSTSSPSTSPGAKVIPASGSSPAPSGVGPSSPGAGRARGTPASSLSG